jgi:aspartate-semialdehyde dehydrogenase
MTSKIPVTILGSTGMVGQRFVERLVEHPRFEIRYLAASERSTGQSYGEAAAWRLTSRPYGGLAERPLVPADPEHALCPVVFSALDTGPAREIEPAFAAAGSMVFSNASAFRMAEDVPLLVPEVNADHLDLIEVQRRQRGTRGAIVCNPNCTATMLVMALAPLEHAFGIDAVMMSSMQALSGAGYPGVASLDIQGNVIPFIGGEEEKVEEETPKILGKLRGGQIEPAKLKMSAMCHRVGVVDGHTEAVSVSLRGSPGPAQVLEAMQAWHPLPQQLKLHSAPERPLRLHSVENRPQPRLDVERDGGMSVHVGRVRRCPLLGIKFTVLGHNTQRGAAGASILNAELALQKEMLPSALS